MASARVHLGYVFTDDGTTPRSSEDNATPAWEIPSAKPSGARRERTSRKPSRKRFSKTEHTRTNPQRARVTPRAGRASPRMGASVGPAGDARRAGARGADAAMRVPQRVRRATVSVPRLRVRRGAAPHARGAHAGRAQRRGVEPGVRPHRHEARHRVAGRHGHPLGGAGARRARARTRQPGSTSARTCAWTASA